MEMKMLINGNWIESHEREKLKKLNPVDGKILGYFQAGKKTDVDEAIDAADESFEKWNQLGSLTRSKYIYKAKELIERKREELVNLLILENGKILSQAEEEVDGVIDQLQYYAEFARKITGDVVEGSSSTRKIFQYRIPYGVVVAITPWNFPAGMVARKIAPALLTGNTVVVKPSSDTPFTAEWIVRKFVEAGIPNGVLNLVTGKGAEIGDYIVEHRKVSLITMTGSTSTGQSIMKKASANMAKLILELGGKAPFIIWKDANIKNALKSLIWAKFWNSGQSCIAAERLYIHKDIYREFMEKFVSITKRLKVGDPRNSDIGPLINKGALQATELVVKNALDTGSKVLYGGRKPDLGKKYQDGYFYEPTIIEDGDQGSPLFQEEIFSPVIAAMPVSTVEEAQTLANDSKYGLASYLFTENPEIIFKFSDSIRFGELYINMPGPEASQGYHTGFRLTGQGGEGSIYGIEEYLKLKNIYVEYSGKELSIPTLDDKLFERI
ncbi:MAG: D-glyceraldehyde dehydrogenase [Thermoplasmatales archaeon]